MARTLLNQRAYAEHRRKAGLIGATQQAVCKAIKAGRISTIDGKIDPEVADIQWAEKTDAVQQLRGASGGHPPATGSGEKSGANSSPPQSEGDDQAAYWAARRRREVAEARSAELDLEERQGALLRRTEVENGAQRTASTVVQHLESATEQIPAEFGVNAEHRSAMRRRMREIIDRIRDEFARAVGLQVQ